MPASYKAHFRRFLEADPERLHFAAHSHHLWPDVTFEAQGRCWLDAARLADAKWDEIFGRLYPRLQDQVARLLGLSDPASLAFGPNTHGFLLRLLSCLPADRPPSVLTTDGEFHSFARQMRRLAEDGLVRLEVVPTQPFAGFAERFRAAATRVRHDLVYLSQVFYDSGYEVRDLPALVEAAAGAGTLVAVDGYHAFLALPTDLAAVEGRAFYLAGGYKYAMAGEGTAFLHAPPGLAPRPRDTGWFASFGALEGAAGGPVPYPGDGARFLGATFDPVGLYRLAAVLDWLQGLGITVAEVHARAHRLQALFVAELERLALGSLRPEQLAVPLAEPARGNFLTFRTPEAARIQARLREAKVVTDRRGERLRFGFGLYHDAADVEELCRRLGRALG